MEKSETYSGIDVVKLVCAFLVIAIHTSPFEQWSILDAGIGVITRVAVPFYFIAAGFFFFGKENITRRELVKYLKRLAILYGVWSIIYLPFYFSRIVGSANLAASVLKLVRLVLLDGTYDHLWYFPALVFAIIITMLLTRKLNYQITTLIALLFLICGIMLSTYRPLLDQIGGPSVKGPLDTITIFGIRNGLFYGFFYVAMGAWISRARRIRNIKLYIVMLIISIFALCLEAIVGIFLVHTRSTILWFSVVPVTYALFMIARESYLIIDRRKSAYI